MTIPQLISSVGWFLFSAALVFNILHTVNLAVPGIDFLISTSRWGLLPYLVSVPILIFGLALGVIGFFAERIEEWWINKDRYD
jgi:hypothetical protein